MIESIQVQYLTYTTPSTATSASTVATSSGSETSTTDITTTVMSVESAEIIKQLFETQSLMFTAQMQAPPSTDGQSDGDDEEFDLSQIGEIDKRD